MPVRLAITLTAIVLFAAPVHAQKKRLDRKRPVLVRSQEPAPRRSRPSGGWNGPEQVQKSWPSATRPSTARRSAP